MIVLQSVAAVRLDEFPDASTQSRSIAGPYRHHFKGIAPKSLSDCRISARWFVDMMKAEQSATAVADSKEAAAITCDSVIRSPGAFQ